jgi:hypothetical protein
MHTSLDHHPLVLRNHCFTVKKHNEIILPLVGSKAGGDALPWFFSALSLLFASPR